MSAAKRSSKELPPITREIDLTPAERKNVKKSVMGAMAGNAIEWFDYGIYGYLTGYLTVQIFGDTDGESGAILWVLFGFAISFLVRPLGGAILGPLVGGWILASSLGLEWNFYFFGVVALVGALLVSLVPRRPLT